MVYLGLDIGNTGCKAVAYRSDGTLINHAYREYALVHPAPGYAELESEKVISLCFEIIKEINSLIDEPIAAMCISSNGEAFTPVDNQGNCLCNAMIASDTRAIGEVQSFVEKFGKDKLYRITGHTAHPIFTLFKLLWLKKNRVEIWNKAKYFLCFEDLMIYKLGISPCISWPMAGRTMLFDVTNHCWSSDICNEIGLDSSKLAQPKQSGNIIGVISPEIARQLGFKNEVAVVSGGHDQVINALGVGITEPGQCMYATGTVECFCPMFDKQVLTSQLMNNNLCCYDFAIKDKYTTVAYNLTGGNIIKWFRDEFGDYAKLMSKQEGRDVYEYLLHELPAKPTSLLVLPYFTGSGTPYFDSHTRGAIVGLQFTTSQKEIIKALLEGITLEMKLNLELMEESGIHIHSFIAAGGGTRNDEWNQIKADVLNRPVIVREVSEAGCYGAAMLACSAVSGEKIENLIKNKNRKIFYPNAENASQYSEKYLKYKALYQCIKNM